MAHCKNALFVVVCLFCAPIAAVTFVGSMMVAAMRVGDKAAEAFVEWLTT